MLSRPPQATFLNRYLLAGERPVSGDRFVFVRSLNRIKNGEGAYGVRCLMVGPLSPYRGPCQSRFRMSEDEMQTELRISFAPSVSVVFSLLLSQWFRSNRVSYSQLWSLEGPWRCTSGSRPSTETPVVGHRAYFPAQKEGVGWFTRKQTRVSCGGSCTREPRPLANGPSRPCG
jgi:hypothetical protein